MASISATQMLAMGTDAIYLANRPPPNAPTGYYDWQITEDTSDDREGHSTVANLINAVEGFKAKGGFKPDPSHIAAFVDTIQNPTAVDDRKGAFTAGLGILSKLDPSSDLYKKLNNNAINTLFNTIPHPPSAYLGPTHCFRQADGGGNNLESPDIGRAGTSYARSVQGKTGLPRSSLPDAGLIYDAILKRKGVQNHPGGMSSLIFAFASIVTHSLFRTDTKNININNASSYLDLSPVYGDNQAAQDKVRDKASGRGFLFPDAFSEERLIFLPPATSVLLVLFSRNHNYIAEKLLKINERKRWSDPPPTDEIQRSIQDEEIFQTARLVNGGHFMSAIMGDYVAGFLGSAEGTNWNLAAFDPIKTKDFEVERGRGNHVSVEFNVLYRWHSTTSEADEKWTEGVLNSVFGGKPFEELSLKDLSTLATIFDKVEANPAQRTFAGLQRGADGKFSDDDLARILQSAIESPAGAFRGRGTPPVLRLVEIMGIEQARSWGACTMNEFRKFLGLKQFETFEEWNPDPEIAEAARLLYGHVDNLELYTGLQAESTIPLSDGFQFACGYTTTRGVLGDAIALIRGDRFYTTDMTPANLTTWGYYDCQREMYANGELSAQIPKLILRHLPRHFAWNSIYALYPFFTPVHMKETLTTRGLDKPFNFDHPVTARVPKILNTFTAIKTVFNDPGRFKHIYQYSGYGSMLMFDDIAKHDTDKALVLHALFPEKDTLNQYAMWCAGLVRDKIKERSLTYPNVQGKHIDIVNVINAVAAHFSADKLMGIPLKTKENPRGVFTENEMFEMLAVLFVVTFLTFNEPEKSFGLHLTARQAATSLGLHSMKSIMEVSPSTAPSFAGNLVARIGAFMHPPDRKDSYPFLSKLTASGRPLDQLLGNLLGLAVGASVNFAHSAENVIDFYLDDAREKERVHILQLVNSKDPKSSALLRGYVCEAMRLVPQTAALWRDATVDCQLEQGPGLPPIDVKAGDRLWASFRNAHLNPLDFPEPHTINPTRPLSSYNLNGTGFHVCPGTNYAQLAIVEILRVVFKLKNLRRAPGDAGKLIKIVETIRETEMDYFVQRNGKVGPWPGSMVLVYDE